MSSHAMVMKRIWEEGDDCCYASKFSAKKQFFEQGDRLLSYRFTSSIIEHQVLC